MKLKMDIREVLEEFDVAGKVPESVMVKGHRFFKDHTPIDSGNARRSTQLNKTTIEANYPYAQRLDSGWSRQAPDGMTQPTIDYIEKELEKQIKRGR